MREVGLVRPIERILGVVRGEGGRNNKGEYVRLCPAHNDQNTPNLNIGEKEDGTAVVWCSAGCEQDRVLDALDALGVHRTGLFPSRNGRGGEGSYTPSKNGSTDQPATLAPVPGHTFLHVIRSTNLPRAAVARSRREGRSSMSRAHT